MRVVGLVNAVHDSPVYISAHALKGYAYSLSDHARCPITPDKELGADDLCLPGGVVANRSSHRMTAIRRRGRVHGVVFESATPLNKTTMSREISYIDPLDLALGDDV